MLPFFKVFSLLIRAFSKPLIAYTKKHHSNNKHSFHRFLRGFFMRLGNTYNIMETKVNKKFLKIEVAEDLFIKPLSEDVAVDKGVEFFYEIIFYSIILCLPLYEMWKQQESNQKKSDDLNKRLSNLDNEILSLKGRETEQREILTNKIENLESLIIKNDKNASDVLAEMNKLKFEIDKLIQVQLKAYEKVKQE